MNWKIKRDKYYSELYEKYGREYIDYAGFFEDETAEDFDIIESLNIPCTPLDYVRKNLHKENPVILLSTGSFNPVHDGHIEMMEVAKRGIEEKGFNCIGGFIAPDHDHYMKLKLGNEALPIHKRIKLLSDATRDKDWLNIDPWAGVFHTTSINFTDIITRLELYIEENIGFKIPIIFVCGGDNHRFGYTFAERGSCIVISRPSTPEVNDKYNNIKKPNGNTDYFMRNVHHFWNDNPRSSTKIRETFEYPKDKRIAYLRANDNSIDMYPFMKLLEENFAKISVVHVAEQKNYFNKFIYSNKQPTISLDPFIKGNYDIGVSRLYDSFGIKKLGYTKRPDNNAWSFICALIKRNNDAEICDLFDDDIDSGGTMDFITNYFNNQGIKINKRISITKSNNKTEVIDIRDFIYKSDFGGLVVTSPDGKINRVPYIYPFVCPYNRASITNPMGFSKKIWELNIKYFEKKYLFDLVDECKFYLKMIEKFDY